MLVSTIVSEDGVSENEKKKEGSWVPRRKSCETFQGSFGGQQPPSKYGDVYIAHWPDVVQTSLGLHHGVCNLLMNCVNGWQYGVQEVSDLSTSASVVFPRCFASFISTV